MAKVSADILGWYVCFISFYGSGVLPRIELVLIGHTQTLADSVKFITELILPDGIRTGPASFPENIELFVVFLEVIKASQLLHELNGYGDNTLMAILCAGTGDAHGTGYQVKVLDLHLADLMAGAEGTVILELDGKPELGIFDQLLPEGVDVISGDGAWGLIIDAVTGGDIIDGVDKYLAFLMEIVKEGIEVAAVLGD